MITLFNPHPGPQSLEDRILALTDATVRVTLPEKLRESGMFSELEIDHIVFWLLEYRAQHHLEIIE